MAVCAGIGSPLQLVNAAVLKTSSVLLQLGLTVISNLAATAEGAALLLKSPLLSKTEQQLHHWLQRREGPRTSALLGPLVNLAVHCEGQKQLLRAASAPGQIPHHCACISMWCCYILTQLTLVTTSPAVQSIQ